MLDHILKINKQNLPLPYSSPVASALLTTNEHKINIQKNIQAKYQPAPVRKEFMSPITLKELKNIDYKPTYHFRPIKMSDTVAYSAVKFLRFFADTYFRKDYVRRAIILETIAAIPGLVGGMYRHLASLRAFKDNGDVIQKLLHEAENERQHLLTFLQIKNTTFLDNIIITLGQPVFFNLYMIFYGLFPQTAHRFVGYLEEEAIRSYDSFESEILKGNIDNIKAPKSAIKYWKLPDNARLIDVVRAVRADEAAHRDANHELANNEPFKLA